MTRYYRMFVDLSIEGWGFGPLCAADGSPLTPGVLWSGRPYAGPLPLRTNVTRRGVSVDGTMLPDTALLTRALAASLREVIATDAEFIPVEVDGAPEFCVGINILRLCDCVDEAQSFIQPPPPGSRVSASDRYYMLSKMRIRSAAVPGYAIFRLSRWPVAIIVSEKVHNVFVQNRASGLAFSEV